MNEIRNFNPELFVKGGSEAEAEEILAAVKGEQVEIPVKLGSMSELEKLKELEAFCK